MNKLAPLVGLVLLLAIVAAVLEGLRKKARVSGFDGQVQLSRLMNDQELALYRALRAALPEHLVFCQVALSQLVRLRSGAPRALTNSYFRLVADFAICTPESSPIAVIELDGRSHRQGRQIERDGRKDAVLKAAGIRVIRLHATRLPEASALRSQILTQLPADGLPVTA